MRKTKIENVNFKSFAVLLKPAKTLNSIWKEKQKNDKDKKMIAFFNQISNRLQVKTNCSWLTSIGMAWLISYEYMYIRYIWQDAPMQNMYYAKN